jgi:Spy/CpxP family protein refolding chaperone
MDTAKRWRVLLAVAALTLATGVAAQDNQQQRPYGPGTGPHGMRGGHGGCPGMGYGPGMMGPGMMGGYGPGMMGPGMMGGYGPGMMGPGMMGGYGPGMMGPGMMGGYGPGMMGPGMMGGYGPGMGPGMMGGYGQGYGQGMGGYGPGPFHSLNLSDKQQKAVADIMEKARRQQWQLMGKLNDLNARLQQLYSQETWDKDAIGSTYEQIGQIQRQMVENQVEARNQIVNQLTDEQRKQFRQWGGWSVQ